MLEPLFLHSSAIFFSWLGKCALSADSTLCVQCIITDQCFREFPLFDIVD
jgi:hypothetical protein